MVPLAPMKKTALMLSGVFLSIKVSYETIRKNILQKGATNMGKTRAKSRPH
jgi:hypothetical protein